ncbi:MAG: hypothetical protein JWO33_2972 [Caulobacteraceae bacterium]|nr:hypothetical protein [Caulobacteraceae bacterium]
MRALFTADGFDSYGSIYSTADVSGGAVSFDQAASFNVGCGCPSCMRTAMLRDAYGAPTASGPGKPAAAAALNPATLLSDDIAGDRSTTATLAADGAPVVSTLNTVGDFDFFKIELKAGQTYEFSLLSKTGGPSGVPLADA